jgi:hypothetical protein
LSYPFEPGLQTRLDCKMIGTLYKPSRHVGTSYRQLLFVRPSSSAAGRRRIDPAPPFPTIPTCPEPTCSCAKTPSNLDIDHERNLNGSMAGYSQQVIIATGQSDWRSRIEEDGVNEGWGILGRGLKGLVGRGGKYSDVRISSLRAYLIACIPTAQITPMEHLRSVQPSSMLTIHLGAHSLITTS